MYVRIARFEGGTPAEVEAQVTRIRQDVEAVARGDSSTMIPPRLASVARKIDVLADRAGSKAAVIVYCDTAEDAAEVDRLLGGMDPPREARPGRRVSADVYEVVAEATIQARRAA
jgi:hypothetical protein